MKALPIFTLLAIVLIGCQTAQQGVPSDVSYVPIDQIPAEDGGMTDITGDVVAEDDSDGDAMEPEATEDEDIVDEVEDVVDEAEDVVDESEDVADEAMEEIDEILDEDEVEQTAQPSGQEIVIIVEETELVSLQPVADDPDADTLDFTYSTPLDNQGQWQTTYGDAGEYTVSITASDGELTSSRDALLIVNKREEPPVVEFSTPEDMQQTIPESTQLRFEVEATDLNGDPITYEWKLDGEVVSVEESYTYESDYESAGSHTVKVDISDGNTVTSLLWSVTVTNVNRAPDLEPIGDITVRETETVVIAPFASDLDGDEVTYGISDPVGDSGVWETTYDDAGVYTVTVSASDGEDVDEEEVTVTVINVNRPPVITDIVQVG